MAASSALSLACAAGCSRADRPVLPSKLYSTPPSCITSPRSTLPSVVEFKYSMLQMVLGVSGLHQCSNADEAHLHHFPCINLARVAYETVEVGIEGGVRSRRVLPYRRGPGWRGADKWQIGAVRARRCLRQQSVV